MPPVPRVCTPGFMMAPRSGSNGEVLALSREPENGRCSDVYECSKMLQECKIVQRNRTVESDFKRADAGRMSF